MKRQRTASSHIWIKHLPRYETRKVWSPQPTVTKVGYILHSFYYFNQFACLEISATILTCVVGYMDWVCLNKKHLTALMMSCVWGLSMRRPPINFYVPWQHSYDQKHCSGTSCRVFLAMFARAPSTCCILQ